MTPIKPIIETFIYSWLLYIYYRVNKYTEVNEVKLKILKVTEETHKRLTELGKKGETYNTIITKLMGE